MDEWVHWKQHTSTAFGIKNPNAKHARHLQDFRFSSPHKVSHDPSTCTCWAMYQVLVQCAGPKAVMCNVCATLTDWATVSNAPVQHLWIGLSSVLRPRQHSIGYMGDGFYRSKDPTNSIKVLKEKIVHRMDQLYDFTYRYVWKPENLFEFDIRYLPMLEVRWRSWFWSTFSIESLFKLPARKNKCNTLSYHRHTCTYHTRRTCTFHQHNLCMYSEPSRMFSNTLSGID